MIRTERLSVERAAFATERRGILNRAAERIREGVRSALIRRGLPSWADPAVASALDVFDETVASESEEPSQVIDDLRAEFERELREALGKVKPDSDREAQIERLTNWMSTMSVNAGTEAATTADPDTGVGLEWVTMGDPQVRESHREAEGQTVPTGQPFTVDGVELLYPGQPVGDPNVWLNCRCVAAPARLTESAGKTITASTHPGVINLDDKADMERVRKEYGHLFNDEGTVGRPTEDEEQEITTSVVVALPKQGDPVTLASSEDQAHVTLLFLGESAEFDPTDIMASLSAYTETFAPEPFEEEVSGTAVLGEDKASVLLLDAKNLAHIRGALLQDGNIRARHDQVEQFPTWIPHLTMGYPDNIQKHDYNERTIEFDRLALWHGGERTEYPLAPKAEVEESEKPPADFSIREDLEEIPVEEAPVEDPVEEEEDEEEVPGDDDIYLPVPWHAVLAPEGLMSGDGRQFANGSLGNRELPLPLKWMPADAEAHGGSVVVGRIDRIWREDNLIKAEGIFDQSENAYEAIRQVATEMIRGVSVDVDDATVERGEDDTLLFTKARICASTMCAIPAYAEAFIALGPWQEIREEDVETEDMPLPERDGSFAAKAPGLKKDGTPPVCKYCDQTATQYVLHSEGMAYVPACDEHIEQAKKDAAESTPSGESDPGNINRVAAYGITEFDIPPRRTKDGPGWITEPRPTQRITAYWVDGRGAAKIGWGAPGDFNRCRMQLGKYVQNPNWLAGLCANLHYRALGVWPGRHAHSGGVETMSQNKSLTASVQLVEVEEEALPADWFRDPELSGPTPLTITPEGRVFGHIADWTTCHIGFVDECRPAPKSFTNYAYFLTGEVLTDAGLVPVGQLTVGGGHANEKYGVRAAISHYDNTTTAWADVTVGEDAHGIWFAGALREGLTAKEMREIRAAALSGDWREVIVGGKPNLEMVAALGVNVQGFPVPRTRVAVYGGRVTSMVAAGVVQQTADIIDLDARIDAVLARRERAAKFASIRQNVRVERVARARKAVGK